ncbi:PPOX class F420-dependent oxidoreductase [Rhodococcus sp. NPDC047139]|uniref:PPOX class F420-dependent oxidoreductase n=1 Tax=Rhodococcus sp. NPDC047139 TaxID=3155141 RepID=UPI0033C42351
MARTPDAIGAKALEFLTEYRLATLATLRKDGSPHLVAVGFTWDADAEVVRIITFEGSQKTLNVERSGYASVNQVDGGRWITLEGPARVTREPADVAEGERRYAARYREPRPNPRRVVIEIAVERVMGSVLEPK